MDEPQDTSVNSPVVTYLLQQHGHVVTHDQVWGAPSQLDPLAPVLRAVWPIAARRLDHTSSRDTLDGAIALLDEVIGEVLDGVAAARARFDPPPLPPAAVKPTWPEGV